MLSDHALIFYRNEIQGTHNLNNLSFDAIVRIFKTKFNTPARRLRLMDEWNTLSIKDIAKAHPTETLEQHTNYLLERLQTLRLYLQEEGISAFMHKCKLLESIRDNPAFHYARLDGQVELDVLESRVQWAASRYAGAPPTATGTTVHLGSMDDDTSAPDDTSALDDADTIEGMFTDRFKRSKTRASFGPSFGSYKSGRSSYTPKPNFPSPNHLKHNRCFVCNKEGCRAYRHSQQERLAAMHRPENRPTLQAAVHNITTALNAEDISEIQLTERDEAIVSNVLDLLDEDDSPDSAPSELGNANNIEIVSNFISSCNKTACAYVFHGLTLPTPPPVEDATKSMKERYNGRVFQGILVDSGCSRFLTGGTAQYLAYCKTHGVTPNVDLTKRASVFFANRKHQSPGTGLVKFPIDSRWAECHVHLLPLYLPILLSLQDMDSIGIYFNNLSNLIIHPASGESTAVERRWGHAFLSWSPMTHCHFTEHELRTMHRRFGHPSVQKLANVIAQATGDNVNPDIMNKLNHIRRHCQFCQKFGGPPQRFKFTLRDMDLSFNHSIYCDVFTINGTPVLHVVDEATRFQAARRLRSMSADELWTALKACWINVYIGPPDVITHDAGTNFIARAFQANADFLHIKCKQVPIEASNRMSIVERYHEPVRRAFPIIKKECPTFDFDETLLAAVKALNESIGPDGLIPAILVFGAMPRLGLPTDKPHPTLADREIAVENERRELSKHFTNRQVQTARTTRNGPDISDILGTPLGSHVIVDRDIGDSSTSEWTGPYVLLDVSPSSATVLTTNGVFRITHVRRYFTAETQTTDRQSPHPITSSNPPPATIPPAPSPNSLQIPLFTPFPSANPPPVPSDNPPSTTQTPAVTLPNPLPPSNTLLLQPPCLTTPTPLLHHSLTLSLLPPLIRILDPTLSLLLSFRTSTLLCKYHRTFHFLNPRRSAPT